MIISQKKIKLISDHCTEAGESDADILNLGLEEGDDFIRSKTSNGVLRSQIDEQGKVTHKWEDEKEVA